MPKTTMQPNCGWVLHPSYPDGTWRGLDKCAGAVRPTTVELTDGGYAPSTHESASNALLLFQTPEDAEEHLKWWERFWPEVRKYWRIVEITVVAPAIRGALDSATYNKVDKALPLSAPDRRRPGD